MREHPRGALKWDLSGWATGGLPAALLLKAVSWWAPPEQLASECRCGGPGVGSLGELALATGPLSAPPQPPARSSLSLGWVRVGGAVGGWSRFN